MDEVIGYVESIEDQGSQIIKLAKNDIKNRVDPKRNLRVLRNEIEIFDMHDFKRLLEKGRSQKALIEGQGALVFIGLSKSGKTTCITSILGYRMRKVKMFGMSTIQSAEPLKGEHARLINSP